jgi:NAD(P)H-hydrate repair Nnr-like enzyme with NAD(P)H-hydrate dehydratase domain
MVRYHGPQAVGRAVLAARPEVVLADGRVQAWVLGPGLPAESGGGASDAAGSDAVSGVGSGVGAAADGGRSDDAEQRAIAQAVLTQVGCEGAAAPVPVVVDAGALPLVADGRWAPWVVLTPHAGELAALLSARGERVARGERGASGPVARADVEAEPLRWARRAHALTGATVLLKGAVTVVVGPDACYAQADAPTWAGTAGSGDVLAGLLGTLLAARADEVVAHPGLAAEIAASAALVHGCAAHRANPGGPVAALAIADALPATIAEVLAAR